MAESEGETWFGVRTILEKGDNIYSNPFNNKDNDISYWEQRSIEELREKYGFNDL